MLQPPPAPDSDLDISREACQQRDHWSSRRRVLNPNLRVDVMVNMLPAFGAIHASIINWLDHVIPQVSSNP
jgi:hypothetical protein